VGELEDCISREDDAISYKPIREAWAEAVKMKRYLEKEIVASCNQLVSSQETMLANQYIADKEVQRLTDMVQGIKNHLQKKRKKKSETKPLRAEIKDQLYQELMRAPSPRYTRHAHAERARKKIVFTLLYYTGARVNELRNVTYNDLMGVIQEGPLKLVLHKQNDAIVRVVPTVGREEMKTEVEFFFIEQKYKFLGESYKKPGEVMHEKVWIFDINKEIKKALKMNDVFSSHSFTLITLHAKRTSKDCKSFTLITLHAKRTSKDCKSFTLISLHAKRTNKDCKSFTLISLHAKRTNKDCKSFTLISLHAKRTREECPLELILLPSS
jgi:hypothetical protein